MEENEKNKDEKKKKKKKENKIWEQLYHRIFLSKKNNSVLSQKTNIVKSIKKAELFQLVQMTVNQDITNLCRFKNENIDLLYLKKKQILLDDIRKQIRCRKRRKRQSFLPNPNLNCPKIF